MNKTLIFVGIGGVAVGGAVGFVVGRFFFKKKLVHQADARVQEAVDLYNEYLEEAYQEMDQNYDDEVNPVVVKEEEPEEKEAEETKEEVVMPKKPGRIICKPLSEWQALGWQDDDGWGQEELWYFPDDGSVLTDEDGNLLEPLGKYIGNNIDRFISKSDDSENSSKFYIWNEPLEKHYLVHKEDNITRDEFFNY